MTRKVKYLILGVMFFGIIDHASMVSAGNDFVNGQLRIDLPEIVNARDYRVKIRASAIPSGDSNDFTTAWLSINLNNQPGLYGDLFTQVGIVTYPDGPHWFVYSEAGVTCLQGHYRWGALGCMGDAWDIVTLTSYHYVELVKYQSDNWWIARFNYADGTAVDVAMIATGNSVIYRATATMEEGYGEASDPYLIGMFTLKNPEYMLWGSGFQVWPQSIINGPVNYLSAYDLNNNNTFCPEYYAMEPNLEGDSRTWFAGTGGFVCDWVLFPPIGTTGIHDDYPSTFIFYTLSWVHSTGWPLAWNHTVSWSNVSGKKASFTFTGSNISRVYTMAANRGFVEIFLDGSYLWATTDYAPTTRWEVVKTWDVDQGDHTIQVVVGSSAYNDLDAFVVDVNSVGQGTYDDPNSNLKYGGNWTHSSGWSNAYKGTLSWSNTLGNFVRITFTGSEIIYYYTMASNRGEAAITIDGVDYGMIDQYSLPTIWQFNTSYSLEPGMHNFHISVPRQKNRLSSDYYVDVDKIVIVP